MKCPFCDNMESKVIDSRLSKEGDITRRRRECERCIKRFTTYERVEETLPLVIKKDGRREPFDRHKVLIGIQKACEKRPVSMETIENMVDDVLVWAQELGVAEINGQQIGERIMEDLHKLDEVAYVRFASVYRSFKDINEFMSELKDILNKPKS
ncbi:MAG: transcriptional regulator NrdR [Deltaproteobacteria bacterium CG11_big_fil_rev_8_21_14_0_20_47_16]|nr:MAG: transcriptional regulator NrdR [Deltaproteobacteria bacterium CG11_big_fil_rev_8_21_14_0_20_47_16]